MNKWKQKIARHILNIPGWNTKRKIIVFESDDWGSIRIPSRDVLNDLRNFGIPVDDDPFSKFDSLASSCDLEHLFETLTSVKDIFGHYPVLTANCVTANPDFDAIRKSNYSLYSYELFTETLKRYPEHSNSFNLWNQGMDMKVFYPQYHGREHLNFIQWLGSLNHGSRDFLFAFALGTYAINSESRSKRNNLLASLDYEELTDKQIIIDALIDGLNLFKRIFDFESVSYTPACYTWNSEIEEILARKNVKYIKTSKVQNVISPSIKKYKKRYHYNGKKNRFGQLYLVRNALFEPSLNNRIDWVDSCLNSIDIAFKWNKPAIICSHRLNFIGYINENNRVKNLKLLKQLLGNIMRKWPEVEFINSERLGNIISNS